MAGGTFKGARYIELLGLSRVVVARRPSQRLCV